MTPMNAHALAVLELTRVLALVAERAASSAGAERVRALVPSADGAWIERELSRVAAVRALTAGDDPWSPEPIPDLAPALGRLRLVGSVLSGEELLAAALLLRSSRRTREALTDEKRRNVATAALEPLVERLVVARSQEGAIERAIDADGTVRDEASPALRKLRRELRGAESELVQLLERVMRRLEPHQQVPDMSVTMRNGRYVIPIRREARGSVGGIVHDESATRATLFVEPPAAIEAGNRIRELESEEADEVLRILAALTDELRPRQSEMAEALDALVSLDSLYARARFADAFDCAPAALVAPEEGFAIVRGRHPLLLAQGGAVVPFDLEMAPAERTLLLSGPNTGGKTVLLKALGLISALVQSGVPAPVGPGSRVTIFDDFFADIGDEQSIAASLSTFSAHLRNLGEILDRADDRSLVLIDELGSGTDPAEGAALGGAILDELTRRGALTVATTHLGTLKLLATENPAVVNASLQFDEQRLAPTFRLIKGIPGRSYGLGIARRLGLDRAVLERAEERLPRGERDVAALLADLEKKDAELAARERELAESREHLHGRLERLDARERRTREAERTLERRSRQEAREYLLQARAEVERTIRALRESARLSEEEIRDARRRVEALVGEQAERLQRMEEEDEPERAETLPGALEVGDSVEVATLGGRLGSVVELRDEQAVVAVGAMKLTVPASTLTRTRRRTAVEVTPVALRGDLPEVDAPSEIDLRGMRVEEMERSLMHALDSAVRADLRMLRIIHGKGTGALRERVAELLRGDSRVRAYRLGAVNEGGAGVTVAELA
jgi:DNA mismatch repair protein MutS2